jgi:hypothetical protein
MIQALVHSPHGQDHDTRQWIILVLLAHDDTAVKVGSDDHYPLPRLTRFNTGLRLDLANGHRDGRVAIYHRMFPEQDHLSRCAS